MIQQKTFKIRTVLLTARSAMERGGFWKSVPTVPVVVKVQPAAPSAVNAPGAENCDHWWADEDHRNLRLAGESLESMKVALTFEGARRRPEVIAAARAGLVAPGWQVFTVLSVAWAGESWARLFPDQRARLSEAFFDPLYLPPVGMAVYPGQSLIQLPEGECAKELEAAGFAVVAVDCKTRGAITRAAKELMKLPKTHRKADGKARVRRFNCYLVAAELEAWDKHRKPSDFMSRIRL